MIDPFEVEFNAPKEMLDDAIEKLGITTEIVPFQETTLDMTPAELNDVAIRQLVGKVREGWLQLGMLLKQSYDVGYWSQVGFESWRDYLEDLGFEDYSKCMKLISVAEMVIAKTVTLDEVNEIGMSKSILLAPAARQGKLTRELVEMAKSAPNRELREALGHRVNENDGESSIECPRCGFSVIGAVWKKKE